jgi:transcriptional regulator with XRE-family HTH domain
MRPSADERAALSHYLRSLRVERWPDLGIKQAELAAAFGVSVPSISSWESDSASKMPTLSRLATYAAFFATRRSVGRSPYRVLDVEQLNQDERERYEALLLEMTRLREVVHGTAAPSGDSVGPESMSHGLFHFPDGGDITIVCARLPAYLSEGMPYANPENPDYSDLYTYADPDALIELFGHLRAVNPTSMVTFKISDSLGSDNLKTHLVLLGGVDFNVVTRDALRRLDMPVRQFRDDTALTGGFEVTESGKNCRFLAQLSTIEGSEVLVEDIAHFYRAISPYNANRTITVCNGTYSRGVYGAVRALTAPFVRDRNESYAASKFGASAQFSVLARVTIMNGVPVAPEWSQSDSRLHEWAPAQD